MIVIQICFGISGFASIQGKHIERNSVRSLYESFRSTLVAIYLGDTLPTQFRTLWCSGFRLLCGSGSRCLFDCWSLFYPTSLPFQTTRKTHCICELQLSLWKIILGRFSWSVGAVNGPRTVLQRVVTFISGVRVFRRGCSSLAFRATMVPRVATVESRIWARLVGILQLSHVSFPKPV